jgi:hypothetical protein
MAATAVADGKTQTLDDLMIAMDVVDTLRHRENLVRRELSEEGRESELIERLRQMYRDQGIDVPDGVLAEGVKALKESRFVYTRAPGGWKRALLTAWALRERYRKPAAALAAALVVGWAAYHFLLARPAVLSKERARIEMTETLPRALRQAHADVLGTASDEAAKTRAGILLADGERAVSAGDRDGMLKANSALGGLLDELRREFTLTIVSRPGESTGVWRRPPGNSSARNYYLIVEPIAPDGRKLSLPIRNEETGATETVAKFGVRVPRQVFDAVGQDKGDDGIVQNNRFGVKRRGMLAVDYSMPFDGGFITKW